MPRKATRSRLRIYTTPVSYGGGGATGDRTRTGRAANTADLLHFVHSPSQDRKARSSPARAQDATAPPLEQPFGGGAA